MKKILRLIGIMLFSTIVMVTASSIAFAAADDPGIYFIYSEDGVEAYSYDGSNRSENPIASTDGETKSGAGFTLSGDNEVGYTVSLFPDESNTDNVFYFSGECSNGNIYIDSEEEFKPTVELQGLTLTEPDEGSCPIWTKGDTKLELKAKKNTTNTLTDANHDGAKPKACVNCNKKIEIAGKGQLIVNGNNKNGIKSDTKVEIKNCSLTVNSVDNGISADKNLSVESGTINVTTTEGKGICSTPDELETDEDGENNGVVDIAGGAITVNSGDDAIHSHRDITITGGTLNLTAKNDDAVHADQHLVVGAEGVDDTPVINVAASYEGLESLVVDIKGGDIDVVASDDGVNAANPDSTQSEPGGRPGGGGWPGGGGGGPQADLSCNINVSGGDLYVYAGADGLDSNGNITVSGGNSVVYAGVNGNAGMENALDVDGTIYFNGGTVFAAGPYNNMTTKPSGTQTYLYNRSSYSKGATVTINDNGESKQYVLPCSVQHVIYTSPTYSGSTPSQTKTLTSSMVSSISSQTYTGSAITPSVTVKDGTKTLTKGTDYTVEYKNNINAGTATVTITGKNNYKGTVEKNFTINAVKLSKVELEKSAVDYTGSEIKVGVKSVTDANGKSVPSDGYTVSYANNTNAGTATVTVTGQGNYTGTASQTFKINGIELESVKLVEESADYTGSEIKIGVKSVADKNGDAVSSTNYTVSYSNNINAGTATVTVTGKNNYEGTATGTFTINAIALKSVELSDSSADYTGSAIKVGVKSVTDKNDKTVSSTNYTVSYSNNINVGTATVTVTGKNNYEGTVTKTFTINAIALKSVELSASSADYTGSAITPSVTVKDGTKTLTKGTDYTVEYKNNINAGTATATITGKNNYTGTVEKTFTINAVKLSKVVLEKSAVDYTGSEIKVGVTSVTDANGKSVPSDGYTVSYANNTNAGTATVTVTGQGNYTGTASQTFKINGIELKSVELEAESVDYTGSAIEIGVKSVKDQNGNAVDSTNYTVSYSNNIDAGTATVTVTGKKNYEGTVTETFKINGIKLESVELETKAADYTGSAIEIGVKSVKDQNGNAVDSTNYTVSYSNNINVGTATVTVTGKNNYEGTVTETFTINAIELKSVVLSASSADYTGSEIKIGVRSVTDKSNKTVSSTDYTVSYSDNVNAGTATVTVTGKNKHKGSVTGTFTINAIALKSVELSASSANYTGSAIEIGVKTVTDSNSKTVSADDYTISYSNNVNVGTATVTVSGKGNHKGSIEKTFAINAIRLSTVELESSAADYTGSPIEMAFKTVKDVNGNAVGADGYTVRYSNNTNAGTATVTVTGKGNYTGTIWKRFTINGTALGSVELEVESADYTGSAIEIGVKSVTDKNGNTVASNNYTVSYSNNINAGTATVTVTGKENYTGEKTNTFVINPIGLSSFELSGYSANYTGSPINMGIRSVKDANGNAVNAGNYTVSYSNNVYPGTATATVKAKSNTNYKGTMSKTFSINVNLSGVTLKSLTKGKKSMTVKWSKNSNADGYQILYSRKSNFAQATTATVGNSGTVSKKIKKLAKKKKYYVKVRCYKVINNATYYSGWSNRKSVKTR